MQQSAFLAAHVFMDEKQILIGIHILGNGKSEDHAVSQHEFPYMFYLMLQLHIKFQISAEIMITT